MPKTKAKSKPARKPNKALHGDQVKALKTEVRKLKKRVVELEGELDRPQYTGQLYRSSAGSSYTPRAYPIQSPNGGGYYCSRCGESCYYDGRCGDSAILTCKCNAAEDRWYSGVNTYGSNWGDGFV